MLQARMLRASMALVVVFSMGLFTFVSSGDAFARPGGGQTFKSSSSGSKSSGGSSYKPSSGSSYKPSSGSSYKPSSGSGSKSSSGSSYSGSSSKSSSGSSYSGSSTYSGSSSSGSDYSGSSSGSDYSGSSYSGSGGGGGGHGLLFFALVVCALGVMVIILRHRQQQGTPDWSSMSSPPVYHPPTYREKKLSLAESFQAILKFDPTFSRVLLEDFLYALYAEVHRSRGGSLLERMAAYLTPSAVQALRAYPATEVRDIIVGALSFDAVDAPKSPDGLIAIQVRFLANYTEVTPTGEQSWYVEELWTLTRSAAIPSRKPEQARTIGCPNCGAPLDGVFQGVCKYCNARVTGEQELDWRVQSIILENREARGPMLTGTVEEEGTHYSTIFDPLLNRNQTALQARDPELSWPALQERIRMIFATFHEAWSAQDLTAMRPFLSDNLFQLQVYWVETYRKQGLRNVSESPQLLHLELCKVETDGHYDLITARIFAQNIDYTVDGQGKVVGGNRSKVRQYTEYWTFLRGKEAHGASRADRACPSCGAPLDKINMAGDCGSCGVKVSAGTFDWVLSRIEQDEVYTG